MIKSTLLLHKSNSHSITEVLRFAFIIGLRLGTRNDDNMVTPWLPLKGRVAASRPQLNKENDGIL